MAKIQSKISATDTSNDGSSTTVATGAFASNFTAGNCVWGHVSWIGSSGDLSTVSDGTNSYTIQQTSGPDSNGACVATFYKANISAVTTPTITATFASAVTYRRIRGEERNNIATASALDKFAAQRQITPGTGTDAVTSGAQTTTVICQVVGVSYDSFSTTIPAAGTGFASTDTATFTAGDCFRTEDLTQGGAGSVAATFTSSAGGTSEFNTHMLALVNSAGGGGGFKVAYAVGSNDIL